MPVKNQTKISLRHIYNNTHLNWRQMTWVLKVLNKAYPIMVYIYIYIYKIKRSFFQAVVVSILLYGCTTWTLTKRLEKKLDGNYTRMLRAILNKSWKQHPTKHQLFGYLPPIKKTIQVRRTRHAGNCWRSRDELIRDVLRWTLTYGRAKTGRPTRTYILQPCKDTGCSPEDLPKAMNDREKCRDRVKDNRAGGTTWWYIYILLQTGRLSEWMNENEVKMYHSPDMAMCETYIECS